MLVKILAVACVALCVVCVVLVGKVYHYREGANNALVCDEVNEIVREMNDESDAALLRRITRQLQ